MREIVISIITVFVLSTLIYVNTNRCRFDTHSRCCDFGRRTIGHIDPHMNVRVSSEMPDKRGTFDAPRVPYFVFAHRVFKVISNKWVKLFIRRHNQHGTECIQIKMSRCMVRHWVAKIYWDILHTRFSYCVPVSICNGNV